MAGPKRKAFVAYASRDEAHAEALLEGVRRAMLLHNLMTFTRGHSTMSPDSR